MKEKIKVKESELGHYMKCNTCSYVALKKEFPLVPFRSKHYEKCPKCGVVVKGKGFDQRGHTSWYGTPTQRTGKPGVYSQFFDRFTLVKD